METFVANRACDQGTVIHRAAVAPLLAILIAACSPETAPAAPAPSEPQAPDSAQRPPGEPAPADLAGYRGSALARQICFQCHDVGAGGVPAQQLDAPSFPELASRSDLTATNLESWIRNPHPTMPGYLLDADALEDLAAYIASLRE